MPGRASRSRRVRAAVGSRVQFHQAVAQRRAHAAQRLAPARRHRQHVVVGLRHGGGVGEDVRERAVGRRQRLAVALHDARGMRARRGHRDLLPEHCAHGDLGAVDAARHAQAGMRGDERREQRVAPEHGRDRGRVGVQVEQPAAARDGHAEVAHVAEAQRALHAARRRATARRSPCRAAAAACAGRRPRGVTSSTPAMARVRRTRTARRARSARGRGDAARSRRHRAAFGAPRRCRSSRGVSANTSRTVSLNWRTLAKPAANATSAKPSSVVSISVRAVWARCARASASGPAPSSAETSRLSWRTL